MIHFSSRIPLIRNFGAPYAGLRYATEHVIQSGNWMGACDAVWKLGEGARDTGNLLMLNRENL